MPPRVSNDDRLCKNHFPAAVHGLPSLVKLLAWVHVSQCIAVTSGTEKARVLGEVRRYPIEIEAKCRMLGFWYSLCSTSNSESPKISNLMFQLCSKLYCACECILLWLMEVHSLLDSSGLSYIWSNQVHSIKSFNRIARQAKIKGSVWQEWQSRVAENSVCCNYRLFKKKFCFEEYLTYLRSTLKQSIEIQT